MQCTNCILDDAGSTQISFDSNGVCNYCHDYKNTYTPEYIRSNFSEEKLSKLLTSIKEFGKGKKYDCLLGVSGGVDSSYLAYLCKQYDLCPLIVHFDNGWNSELAVKNIQSILSKLEFDYHTYIVNWDEFKEMQRAYFKAGVIDIEALTDHAIYATVLKLAKENGIKYVLSGFNYATEAVMPKGWTWKKDDWTNIEDICRKNGMKKVSSFPRVPFSKKLYYNFAVKLEVVQMLNYVEYNKQQAKDILINILGWRDYGGKHYESIFTRFYQAYILPVKFGVDKRKAHLSNLILSGQITREQALEEIKKPVCDPKILDEDKTYLLKKLGFSESEFDAMMKQKPANHNAYKTEQVYWEKYFSLLRFIKKITFRK
jgi:N-acetyl sugar amidotransferase